MEQTGTDILEKTLEVKEEASKVDEKVGVFAELVKSSSKSLDVFL